MAEYLQYQSEAGANQGKLLYIEAGADLGKLAHECCCVCCDCPAIGPTVTFTGIVACGAGDQNHADILNGNGPFQLVLMDPVLGDCSYEWLGVLGGQNVWVLLTCNQSVDPLITGWRLIGRVAGLDYFRADPDLAFALNCATSTSPPGYACPYGNLGGEDGTALVEW